MLRQRGLADATALALARTMATARTNGAIACLRRETGEAGGFATLAGANGLWILVADPAEDGDSVSAQPASAAEVRARLARLCAPTPARR
jgi:hypothetical protein